MGLVNGHHREKAVLDLKAVQFQSFPLPKTFLCKIYVRISKWDHFVISKKANFVSSAAVDVRIGVCYPIVSILVSY